MDLLFNYMEIKYYGLLFMALPFHCPYPANPALVSHGGCAFYSSMDIYLTIFGVV